ncbi:hypothetical protein B0T18DRAFT_403179 [Schizothecium vesticola]|uniref:Uncharacterized protein n=1 Tax=Schizothecium vesticola TaxID=314040 RepID=A0AA40F5Z5_9PEZI|nr:hypothetical protein B0T18DRAFT_403179 [Schizothecium vesticola]
MPIRNPFARRHAAEPETSRPGSAAGSVIGTHPGFERVDTVGSKASSALSIRSNRSQDAEAYKMSVVNDSGIYLPPSPLEKEATWPKRYLSRPSTDSKVESGDIEHFSISRESFDSYRRSFDICAKSPIVSVDAPTRGSLDSARLPRFQRTPLGGRRFGQEFPTPDESFEEVGLDEEDEEPTQPASKKHGFFSKFGADSSTDGSLMGSQSLSRFLPGRKRAQSGQGAELGAVIRPMTDMSATETSLREQEVRS